VDLTTKPFLTVEEQLNLLQSRGMTVSSQHHAEQWLNAVGYYRLSGYWFVFKQSTDPINAGYDRFRANVDFEDVAQLYEFDRKLRGLVFEAVERVEVALRAQLAYALGGRDPLAYLDARFFRPPVSRQNGTRTFDRIGWYRTALGRVIRSRDRDTFIQHHIADLGAVFPIWVLLGVSDFGDISKLFDGCTPDIQREVTDFFGLDVRFSGWSPRRRHPLAPWIQQVGVFRNIAAHHARLWNRNASPATPGPFREVNGLEALPTTRDSSAVYGALTFLLYLVAVISPGSSWCGRMKSLIRDDFSKITGVHYSQMGFPDRWETSVIWW
jgi:abortive infection bacteriophage resistance protein